MPAHTQGEGEGEKGGREGSRKGGNKINFHFKDKIPISDNFRKLRQHRDK